MNHIKPRRSNYASNEPSTGSWLSVSTSLIEGVIGNIIDESEHDLALLFLTPGVLAMKFTHWYCM